VETRRRLQALDALSPGKQRQVTIGYEAWSTLGQVWMFLNTTKTLAPTRRKRLLDVSLRSLISIIAMLYRLRKQVLGCVYWGMRHWGMCHGLPRITWQLF